jgi:NDP-sugar pyrophosphorylase family protein
MSEKDVTGCPSPQSTQVVVLAGGLGTRLLPMTREVPKILAPIDGRPFLLYLLALLEGRGFRRFLFILGHLGGMVKTALKDSGRNEENYASLILDGAASYGTGGAMRAAKPLCDDVFLLVYGDTYLDLDYRGLLEYFWRRRNQDVIMVAYDNHDRRFAANLAVDPAGLVVAYHKEGGRGLASVDAGVSVLRREALRDMSRTLPLSYENEVLPGLIRQRRVAAYVTSRRFYDIGTPTGLGEFSQLMTRELDCGHPNQVSRRAEGG